MVSKLFIYMIQDANDMPIHIFLILKFIGAHQLVSVFGTQLL